MHKWDARKKKYVQQSVAELIDTRGNKKQKNESGAVVRKKEAARGELYSSASSPKVPPGPYSATGAGPAASTYAASAPSPTRKKASPRSPCLTTISPASKTCSANSAAQRTR